jgi:hypothetical protein
MSDTPSQSISELTFEEIILSRFAQLLADPLTDSTRKRQSVLLLLSILSLALFFGIVVPEKVSLLGFEMRVATTPLTTTGTTSTSWTGIVKGALRFNRVLCPVLVYSVLAFWLSVYRDHEAADYPKRLAELDLERAESKQELLRQGMHKEAEALSERLQRATDEYKEKRAEIARQAQPIIDEYRKKLEPLEDEHAKTVEEIKRLKKEDKSDPELESRIRTLSWQLHELDKEGAEAERPFKAALDILEREAEMYRVQKQANDTFRVIWPQVGEMWKLRSTIAAGKVSVQRWRKLWYLLEVAFPSVIGLVAIIVPFLSFS